MTMTRSDSSVAYEPDGVLERYAVPFPVFSPESVHAALVEGYAETPLTGFSVEGMNTESGVYLRFFTPPPKKTKLVIYRWTRRVQETDYPEGGPFPSKAVEQDFDKLTAMAQEEENLLKTVLRVPRDFHRTPAEYLADFFHAAEETTSARDAAVDAATDASASALRARISEENAAAGAADAANSAAEAAASLLQGIPDADETRKGVFRIATRAEAETRKTQPDGPAALVPESLFNATTSGTGLAKGDEVTVKTGPGGVLSAPGTFCGDIRLLPFRAEDLALHAPGWYFANGDQYALASPQGAALDNFPENFKNDWGITVSGQHISIPDMFHSDGRGYFLRAADGIAQSIGGSADDQIRRITGRSPNLITRNDWFTGQTGALTGTNTPLGGCPTGSQLGGGQIILDTAYLGGNFSGTETHPLEKYMTPAIFLGV